MPVPSPELSREEIHRYSRHLMLPEVGMEGQRRLKAASVLVIGTGGLGAPAALYLAAAGVGRIGLVDFDRVDASNLQRQILFGSDDIGAPKTDAARRRLAGLNPHIDIVAHEARLSSENALDLLRPYDIVLDGTDNFPTRYCVNDACVLLKKPNVYGSIFRFEGQATVFDPRPGELPINEPRPSGSDFPVAGAGPSAPSRSRLVSGSRPVSDAADVGKPGPCYRCLYPDPPPPGMVPSCAEGGVLGVLPAVIGGIQATEAVKLILGQGTSLVGRLLRYNALEMSFKAYKLRRDPRCPMCGEHPTITKLVDYEQFCGMRGEESDTILRPSTPKAADAAAPSPTVTPSANTMTQPDPATAPTMVNGIPTVTVKQLQQRLARGDDFVLLDVREPAEWQICHLEQARLVPLRQLPAALASLDPAKEYVVHCKMGGRSAQAVDFLRQQGLNASNVAGGITAWARQIDPGMPVY